MDNQQMTIEQFGSRIKQKYPEYSRFSDAEIGQKMIQKYPQYQSVIKTNTVQTQPSNAPTTMGGAVFQGAKRGLQVADKLTGGVLYGNSVNYLTKDAPKLFSGATALGNELGGSLAAIGKYAQGKYDEGNMIAQDIKPMRAFGGAVQSIADVGSLAVGGGSGILGKTARFAGLSASSGGGSSLAGGNDIKTALTDAFKAGLTGAAIGATAGLIEKGAKTVTSVVPERLYNNALRVTQKIEMAGKSPSRSLLDSKTYGNLGQIRRIASDNIDDANRIIDERLAANPTSIESKKIIERVNDVLVKKYGSAYTPQQLNEIVNSLPAADLFKKPVLTLREANKLRSQIDGILGDRFFFSQGQNPISRNALGVVANELRGTVQNLSGLQPEFKKLSTYITTKKLTDRAIAIADKKFGLGLIDVISGAGGAVIGASSGDSIGDRLKGAALGATGLILGEKIFRSPAMQTKAAVVLDQINKMPTDTAGRISKATITKLLGELFSSDGK